MTTLGQEVASNLKVPVLEAMATPVLVTESRASQTRPLRQIEPLNVQLLFRFE